MSETGIMPQYPGTEHDERFHSSEGGTWRMPATIGSPTCDYSVVRLLAYALADSLGIRAPQEFAVLHGAAYDLVHDPEIGEEADARERLSDLIGRMARERSRP